MRLSSFALALPVTLLALACPPAPPSSTLPCERDAECALGHACLPSDDGARRCTPRAPDASVPDPSDGGVPFDVPAPVDGSVDASLDAGAVDAAQPDSGPSDSGPSDSGASDSGASDSGASDSGASDGGASELDWPAPGWTLRRRLSLTAVDEGVPAGALLRVSLGDTDGFMTAGQALASGDDLRLWHFDGSTWRELPRVLARAGNLGGFRGADDDGAPLVMLRAVRAIQQGDTDDGYWLYTGNPAAGAPPTEGVPAARTLLTHVASTSPVVDTAPQEVARLTVTPATTTETWVVVATWQQRHLAENGVAAFDDYAGGAQLVVDGVAEVPGALQSVRAADGRWQAGTALHVLRGAASPRVVALHVAASDADGTLAAAEVRDARILAFVLPTSGEEAVVVEEPALQTLFGDLASGTSDNALQVTVDAVEPGPHLWLAHNLVHEAPGDSGGLFELSLDDTVVRFGEESWMKEKYFHALFHVGEVSLASDHALRLDYVASTGLGSEVGGITQVFLPLHGLVHDRTGPKTLTVSGSTTPVTVASLTVPETTLPHEYVYLGVIGAGHAAATPTATRVFTFAVERVAADSETLAFHEWSMSNRGSNYLVHVGVAAREERREPATLRALAQTSDAAAPARAEGTFLLWLRYPEVDTDVGELFPAP